MSLYKLSEWQGSSGMWYCADVDQLANKNNNCWTACRVWQMPPADFFRMLVEEYHAELFYDASFSFVGFSFKSQADMRLYKNRTNKLSRDFNDGKGFII